MASDFKIHRFRPGNLNPQMLQPNTTSVSGQVLILFQNNLTVILSPPPDLTIQSFTVPPEVSTDEVLHLEWEVENSGGGATFETYWIDSVVSQYIKPPLIPHPLISHFCIARHYPLNTPHRQAMPNSPF